MADEQKFILDNRDIEWQLDNFLRYCEKIPFQKNGISDNWKNIFLTKAKGKSRDELITLYNDLALAKGDTLAHQAMLLAFFRLLELPQRLMNDFPAMHRSFYYRDLLGLKEREAKPDTAIIHFTLDDETEELFIPAGTELLGGQSENGDPLLYKTTEGLLANQARVAWCGDYWLDENSIPLLRTLFDEDTESAAWSSQGEKLFTRGEGETTAVYGGCAVVSPALLGESGQRTIAVTFESPPDASEEETLFADISAEGQWLSLKTVYSNNTWRFELGADQPAITAAQHLDNFNEACPVLRIRRQGGKALKVTAVSMQFTGATHIAMSTDETLCSPQEEVYPFGAEPTVGRSLHIMAPEWGGANTTVNITLTPRWLDLPDKSFSTWYAGYSGYPDSGKNDNVFTVQALWCSSSGTPTAIGSKSSLFKSNTSSDTAPSGEALKITLPARADNILPPEESVDNPQAWPQWVQIRLEPQDFLHRQYLAQLPTATTQLNPPYTPVFGELLIETQVIDKAPAQYALLPKGYTADVDFNGALEKPQILIGLRGIKPAQMLNLYWRLWGNLSLDMAWDYLSHTGKWLSMATSLDDQTDSFFNSGAWRATLPDDASDSQPEMPPGYVWLRGIPGAAETGLTQAVNHEFYPRLIKVITQAVPAVLANPQTAGEAHFNAPLPANSINDVADIFYGIERIEQPWPSEGGVAAENEDRFFARVAKRLRHRQRVVTRRDAEDLLLDEFPELYQVRWVKYDVNNHQTDFIVIPKNGREDNGDALRPLFSSARLTKMTEFVKRYASPWADIVISNPEYVDIHLELIIKFVPGIARAYGYEQVWQALCERYMPWVKNKDVALSVGEHLAFFDLFSAIQQHTLVENLEALTLRRDGSDASGDIRLLANEVPILHRYTVPIAARGVKP
ncbi:TPA: hypothetical protein QH957_002283 [Enterobacter bugandensis]|nr:hypothetical protein [Enterobacter bugandensis]